MSASTHATANPNFDASDMFVPGLSWSDGQHKRRKAQSALATSVISSLDRSGKWAEWQTVEPRLAGWVKECYVMGGNACCVGNVTPAAEYNIWCDPEAARMVFHSGMKILMVGWEHCRGEAELLHDECEMIHGFDTARATFAMDCNKHALMAGRDLQGGIGLMLPDPVTMAIALDENVCTQRRMHYVDVACDAEVTRGMTVVDQLNVTGKTPNVEVCWAIDFARWKETLYQTLK